MKTKITVKFIFTALLSLSLLAGCKGQTSTENNSEKGSPKVELQEAVITGNVKALEYHINAGTDLNKKDSFTGSTPLMTAATFGKTKMAELLIKAKADLNVQNNEGSTALHNAAFFCRKDIVEILLQNGADKTIKNNYGSTPLASVEVPFQDVKDIYKYMGEQLAPLGLKLDIKRIETTRPIIVELLK